MSPSGYTGATGTASTSVNAIDEGRTSAPPISLHPMTMWAKRGFRL
jgi:hypothetical protein